MVINAIELLHITIEVKLPISGMDRWGIDLPALGVLRYKVWWSLDLHPGFSLA